jgi:phosphosulfolactate synthase
VVARAEPSVREASSADRFLAALGVRDLPPRTSAFDPGYDASTVRAHLAQSGRYMGSLKLSMATWLIAEPNATRAKIVAARRTGVPTVTGGALFEIAAERGLLGYYLDLCGEIGVDRIECGEGFTRLREAPKSVVRAADERGLEVQYEVGGKHDGAFDDPDMRAALRRCVEWLDAGAQQVVVEGRESGLAVGLFGRDGDINIRQADRFAECFGLERVVFEAPTKPSQFRFLDHFGPSVQLGNVRLEEVLRVEIYRRGLHSDAFSKPTLTPTPPT